MKPGGDGELVLEAALTMAHASAVLEQGRARARSADLVVDLSAVTEADSSVLALLFDWQRVAGEAGHQLWVRGLPRDVESLAELYGVADLLPEVLSSPDA